VGHPKCHFLKWQEFALCFHALVTHSAREKKPTQGRSLPKPSVPLLDWYHCNSLQERSKDRFRWRRNSKSRLQNKTPLDHKSICFPSTGCPSILNTAPGASLACRWPCPGAHSAQPSESGRQLFRVLFARLPAQDFFYFSFPFSAPSVLSLTLHDVNWKSRCIIWEIFHIHLLKRKVDKLTQLFKAPVRKKHFKHVLKSC